MVISFNAKYRRKKSIIGVDITSKFLYYPEVLPNDMKSVFIVISGKRLCSYELIVKNDLPHLTQIL